MAAWTYDRDLNELLKSEGGYTNNPSDPGGPTNYGITIYDFRMYVMPNATASDVRNMKLSDAKVIYKQKYWNKMRCDDLPAGVDYAIFDYGVNSGVSRAAKVLQRLVGIGVDGVIGDATVAATLSYCNAHGTKALIDAICSERLKFLEGLRTWGVFGKGWKERDEKVDRIGDEEAAEASQHTSQPVPTNPTPQPVKPKAPISQSVDPQKQVGGLLNTIFGIIQSFLKRKS